MNKMSQKLSIYFMKIFLKHMLGIFFICFAIIFMVDLVEQLRQFYDHTNFSFITIAQLTLFRTPTIAEQIFPFSILIGAITGFVTTTRHMELAIARAAGLSVWQFIRPALAIAFLLGVFSSLAYNPIAVFFWEASQQIEISRLSQDQNFQNRDEEKIWIRQDGPNGQSILSADHAINNGKTLLNVIALVFDQDNRFIEEVEAISANWNDGYWTLNSARVITATAPPVQKPVYELATSLNEDQINSQTQSIENITFWGLSNKIEATERAGLNSNYLRLKYQNFLSRPLLFMAMVIIAATVSLKFTRFGNTSRMILGGITSGFMLYIIFEIAGDFGANGLLPPILAGWLPAILAVILGVTVLLYQEDG